MRLGDFLSQDHLRRTQRLFSFDVSAVNVAWGNSDGPSKVCARTSGGGLFSDSAAITFDPADVPAGQRINMDDLLIRETVLHELVHVEQLNRGFFYRLKMKLWRKFCAYDERPHEIEAYTKSRAMLQQF